MQKIDSVLESVRDYFRRQQKKSPAAKKLYEAVADVIERREEIHILSGMDFKYSDNDFLTLELKNKGNPEFLDVLAELKEAYDELRGYDRDYKEFCAARDAWMKEAEDMAEGFKALRVPESDDQQEFESSLYDLRNRLREPLKREY